MNSQNAYFSFQLSREILGEMSNSLEENGYFWVSEAAKDQSTTVKNYKQCHYTGSFGCHGKHSGEFFDPLGICSMEKHICVTDAIKNTLSIFRLDQILSSIGNNNELDSVIQPIAEHELSSVFEVTSHNSTGSVFVTDPVENCIRCFGTETDNGTSSSSSLFSDTITLPGFKTLSGLSVTSEGILCTVDSETGRVIICDGKGNIKHMFGSEGQLDGQFCVPQFLYWDEINKRLLISDTANARVQAFTIDGRFLFSFGTFDFSKNKSCFEYPSGILSDDHGRIFVVDQGLNNVQIFDRDGNWLHQLGGTGLGEGFFHSPKSLCLAENGGIFVTDSLNYTVQYFS